MSLMRKIEVDSRSIYVGNVDFKVTDAELKQHFYGCGPINRVTILCNQYDGHPQGFAYIEFELRESIGIAMVLNGSKLKGRQIEVEPKRLSRPGLSTTNRPPRGMHFRGGGRGARARRGYRLL